MRSGGNDREAGFTFVEVLVVVGIIGVIAGIAMPMFLGQRQSAWASAVASDLNVAALQMETAVMDGTYPDQIVQTERTALLGRQQDPDRTYAVALSPGVAIDLVSDGQHYCLCGYHDQLGDEPVVIHDSTTGHGVEACGLDDVPACAAPTILAAETFPGVRFQGGVCGDGGCTYSGGFNFGRGIQAAVTDPLENATLRLQGVSATGGWGVSFGEYGDDGMLANGFVVQIEPAGQVRVQGHGTDTRNIWLPAVDGVTTGGPYGTVEAAVNDGHFELRIDGTVVHTEPLGDVAGTFGIRQWGGSELSVADADLVVE